MKIIYALILSWIIFSNCVFAQNYILLEDETGYGIASYENELEAAADSLVSLLPTEFQDSFKVITKTFYIPSEYFNSGAEGAFISWEDSIDTEFQYYLLIGVASDNSKMFEKYYVQLKLPDITFNGCIADLRYHFISAVEGGINNYYLNNGRLPDNCAKSIVKGIEELNEILRSAIYCCDHDFPINECLLCENSKNIIAELQAMQFKGIDIADINDTLPASNEDILDYASKTFKINDIDKVNLSDGFEEILDSLNELGISAKLIITDEETICNSVWDSLKNIVYSYQFDMVFWYHINKSIEPGQPDRLYSALFIKDPNRAVPAIIAILKGLSSVAIDAMIQTFVIYIVDDDVSSFEEAFKKVDWWSAGFSGVIGALSIDLKFVEAAGAAANASAIVLKNAYENPSGYDFEEGLGDFSFHFIGSYLALKAGSKVAIALKNINVSFISEKGLNKLSKIFGESISQNQKFIKLVWKLEASGVTTHLQRGNVFEEMLYRLYFSINNYHHTSTFFKGIDFWKASSRLGVSLKTTIQTEKSKIKEFLRQNILDLRTAKIEGYIEHRNESYDILDVKLLVVVPEENVTAVSSIMQEIMSELDPDNLIEWEVKQMEYFIN